MTSRVRSPLVAYKTSSKKARSTIAVPDPTTPAERSGASQIAKLFANGRSQAVRLPKEFRLPGSEVRIHREGSRIILEPLTDVPRDANGWPLDFWDTLCRLSDGLDPEDFQIPADPVPPPITPLDQR